MSGIIRRKVEFTAAKGKSAGASKEETEPESCGVNDQGGRETDDEAIVSGRKEVRERIAYDSLASFGGALSLI